MSGAGHHRVYRVDEKESRCLLKMNPPIHRGKTPPGIQGPCSYEWSQFLQPFHHSPIAADVLQDAAIEGRVALPAALKHRQCLNSSAWILDEGSQPGGARWLTGVHHPERTKDVA